MEIELNRWDDRVDAWLIAETDDYYVHISPMIYNHRIVLTPKSNPVTYDVGWCYNSMLAAVAAVATWQYELAAEPTGYVKLACGEGWVTARRAVLAAQTTVPA